MKEFVTLDDESSLCFSPEDAKNTIVVMSGLSTFLLGQERKRDLDIISYDWRGDISWSIWTIRRDYRIFDKVSHTFMEVKSRGDFLEKVKDQYPEDFDFFIWNPDILEGVWNIPTGE